jgi:hypothetical protein
MMSPKYSRSHIDRVGEILAGDNSNVDELKSAMATLDDWRGLHFYPMKTFDAMLRLCVSTIDSDVVIVQRLKRTPTIVDKLKRYKSMGLGRMQDVGGLRVIVDNVVNVREVKSKLTHSQVKHVLKRNYDYIDEPKESGYRGIHLVYEYQNSKRLDYDGLFIEIQLRTRLQHLWATAVETAGFFTRERLKSSQGKERYLEFFRLVSALFAIEEGQPPNIEFHRCTRKHLIDTLHDFEEEYGVLQLLSTIQAVSSECVPHRPDVFCWLINTTLDPPKVLMMPFSESYAPEAMLTYTVFEGTDECRSDQSQVVLVRADSVSSLEDGYLNYFLDVREFIETVIVLMHE